jgi:excisionase family DNA binding protein
METARVMTPKTNVPQFMNREKLAMRLDVSMRTVDALLMSGRIRSVKIGRKRVVSEQAVLDFIRKEEARVR